jgi:hypothetical protein
VIGLIYLDYKSPVSPVAFYRMPILLNQVLFDLTLVKYI